MILRPHASTQLCLAHRSLGDRYAQLLAAVLDELPQIDSLDLRDNRMSDAGLAPLISAVCDEERLLEVRGVKG